MYLSFLILISFLLTSVFLFYLPCLAVSKIRKPTLRKRDSYPPVSVIICARNEEKNLQAFLPSVLQQNYPQFEVIVVNDRSTDETAGVLGQLSSQHPNLRIINNLGSDLPGKRSALKAGIEAASFEHLLLTDADCQPASRSWISHMVSGFDNGSQIVLGVAPYIPKKSLLGLLVWYESLRTAYYCYGLAALGYTYMGIGRNLAYTKSYFYSLRHFDPRLPLSGDDDITINRGGLRKSSIILHKQAAVYSLPPLTFNRWIQQKIRHYKAGWYYSFPSLLLLSVCILAELVILFGSLKLITGGYSPIFFSAGFLFLSFHFLHSWLMSKYVSFPRPPYIMFPFHFPLSVFLIFLAFILSFVNTTKWQISQISQREQKKI